MIHLACSLPKHCLVAVSGGADSMAALGFLMVKRSRVRSVIHFNHGTVNGDRYEELVSRFCGRHDIPLRVGRANKVVNNEVGWRTQRLKFFTDCREEYDNIPVVTGHNLDDAVEWWILTSLRGRSRLMPIEGRTIKPFLFTTKQYLREYCSRNWIPYVDDPTNTDLSNSRSVIREKLLPAAVEVHPGLYSTVRNKY